jgi:hypothetical protein
MEMRRMRREHRDELLRSCLAINALLRSELDDVRKTLRGREHEEKHNPNWRLQPRAPRGTAEGGRWVDGGAAPRADGNLLRRVSGDPMDGADAATFGEILNFERTRGNYTRALETTEDPRQRLRIANDRAMLARQVFGNFSGEEEQEIYTEEMRTRRNRIALGSTDLSERALRLRETANARVGDGRNVAVIEYRNTDGNVHYVERVSGDGVHAEELAIRELERLRVPRENVTRIYTDRQPCRENCHHRLRLYTNARVTWAVDWPDDEAGREIANTALERQIRSYRLMESQGTLPLPLWRYPNPAGNDPPRPRRRRRR